MGRPARRSGNLPAEATSFIGRRRELAEIQQKLGKGRLVSLVGPGGVGKSRLAIRAATILGRNFREGAWIFELAEVRDPELVPNAVLSALNLRDQAATQPLSLLLSYLRDRELLLVADGCEHLIDAVAALVAELISVSPGTRVLATTRQPLALMAEQVIAVPPLELPAGDASESLARLRENEAVKLFCERASAAGANFDLRSSNQATVVDLCRRLDGLPLALELAAVRTRVLSVEQVLDRLTDRFALLTDGRRAALPRHQTLRLTIDWSHDLLDRAERILFRRLSVFAGRFTLEDVEAVCASDRGGGTLDLLSALIDKSLVTRAEAGAIACFRLHETIREYAALRLREADEEDAFERRCADYYRTRCGRSMADARYRLVEWLQWIDLEIDNIRVVLRQCLARGDIALGMDLAVSIGWYWITRATTEGIDWLEELIERVRGSAQSQALAYFLRGFLAMLKGDPSDRGWLERAADAAREAQMLPLLSGALSMASVAEGFAGNFGAAAQLLGEAEVATEGLHDLPAIASLLQARSLNAFFQRDLEVVKSASSEGIRLCRAAGDLYPLEMMLINLGIAEALSANLDESKRLYREALQIAKRIDHRVAQYYLLDLLGRIAASAGEARLAAQLTGAAQTVRTETGARMLPIVQALMPPPDASLIATLGAARFQAEVDAGQRLGGEEAIRLALGEPAPAPVVATAREDPSDGLLGKREAEVAKLVAEGLSNRQIGVRLFISERTVDGHLRNILNKLGVNSRAQIAGWMARQERRS